MKMPKTVEELEKELADLSTVHKTELAAKDQIIEERNSAIADAQKREKELKDKLGRFEKAEFEAVLEEYHSVYDGLKPDIRKKYGFKDPKDYSVEEIHSVENIVKVYKAMKEGTEETHGARSEPPDGTGGNKDTRSAALKELDR